MKLNACVILGAAVIHDAPVLLRMSRYAPRLPYINLLESIPYVPSKPRKRCGFLPAISLLLINRTAVSDFLTLAH